MNETLNSEAVEQEAPAPVPAPPAPAFVAGKSRSETVKLEWPLEYDGKIYEQITITRPTTADLEAWRNRLAQMRAEGRDTDKERLPMFDAPGAVIDALDPDDDLAVSEVAERFLPRRFRGD